MKIEEDFLKLYLGDRASLFDQPKVSDLKSLEKIILEEPTKKEIIETGENLDRSEEYVVVEKANERDLGKERYRNIFRVNKYNEPPLSAYTENRLTPQFLFKERSKLGDPDNDYTGFGIWNKPARNLKITTPSMIKEGIELFVLSEMGEKHPNLPGNLGWIDIIGCKHEYESTVPSRTIEDKVHEISIEGLPTRDTNYYERWINTGRGESKEPCKDSVYARFTHEYKNSYPELLDAHFIASYNKALDEFHKGEENTERIMIQLPPWLKPEAIGLMDDFKDRFLVKDSNGKRPTRKTEQDKWMMYRTLSDNWDYEENFETRFIDPGNVDPTEYVEIQKNEEFDY